MLEYILRLLILLPIVGGMAWGSLWLWKRVQMGMPIAGGQKQGRPVEMVGVLPLGPGPSSRSWSLRDSSFCSRCRETASRDSQKIARAISMSIEANGKEPKNIHITDSSTGRSGKRRVGTAGVM